MQLRSLLTLIALCLSVGLFAQTTAERAGNRAKNRAEYKAQSKVDNKVDKAVDDTFNAIGGLFKKKKDKDQQDGTAANPAGTPATVNQGGQASGNDGEYEGFTNPYTFSMDMEVTETKSNGKSETSSIRMAVTTNRYAVLINDPDGKGSSRMIFNTEDGKTTMITTDKNGDKTGLRMKMPGTRQFTSDVTEELSDRFVFTRTGERKNVNGYDCEKIIVEDTKEGTTTESWVTKDLGMNAQDVFSGFMGAMGGRAKMGNGSVMEQPFEGFPIMSTTVDKGKTYVTNFKNILIGEDKYDSSLMDTSGVVIQSLGF